MWSTAPCAYIDDALPTPSSTTPHSTISLPPPAHGARVLTFLFFPSNFFDSTTIIDVTMLIALPSIIFSKNTPYPSSNSSVYFQNITRSKSVVESWLRFLAFLFPAQKRLPELISRLAVYFPKKIQKQELLYIIKDSCFFFEMTTSHFSFNRFIKYLIRLFTSGPFLPNNMFVKKRSPRAELILFIS